MQGRLGWAGNPAAACLHLRVEAVVQDEAVRHAHAVGLHRVPLPVVVLPDLGVIEVRHLRKGRRVRACE